MFAGGVSEIYYGLTNPKMLPPALLLVSAVLNTALCRFIKQSVP